MAAVERAAEREMTVVAPFSLTAPPTAAIDEGVCELVHHDGFSSP